ncbi:MAG TPA: hypothetical protein VK190_04495 [Pseudoneobacillus sp.]|nr:hypothetical protein [Pseudoneobacillus sp.]
MFIREGNVVYKTEVIQTGTQTVTVKTIYSVDEEVKQPPTLDELKQQKIAELEEAYVNSFTIFTSSALGEVKTYPINKEAQDNLDKLQRRLIADPNKDSFYFYTVEDATLVLHNKVQFLQLLEDAETFEITQHLKFNDLKNKVLIAEYEDEIDAVIW